jgi:magnesium-transporting ATPase (P-type)
VVSGSSQLLARGLSKADTAARLAEVGPNSLPEAAPPSTLARLFRQLANPLVYLLLFALGLDFVLWLVQGHGSPIEAIAIDAVLALNAGPGALQEQRSEKALAQLEAMAAPLVWVFRDGALVHLASRELVPGDVVRIEAGERVPADGRLLEAQGLAIDESVLTGESVAVDKGKDSEVSSGTLAVRGKGLFEVTRTGGSGTMGRLASMLGTIVADKTPLERRLDVFGGQIAKIVGGLAVELAIAGLMAEGFSQLGEVVLFAVALAVAAARGHARRRDADARFGRAAHGQAQRGGSPALGRGGARVRDGDRHRQDGNPHGEPNAGACPRGRPRRARGSARRDGARQRRRSRSPGRCRTGGRPTRDRPAPLRAE